MKFPRSIVSSNDKLSLTAADGRTKLRHLFKRLKEVSRELHYVLGHPNNHGTIVVKQWVAAIR